MTIVKCKRLDEPCAFCKDGICTLEEIELEEYEDEFDDGMWDQYFRCNMHEEKSVHEMHCNDPEKAKDYCAGVKRDAGPS